jgi:hypothetical protein
MEDSQRIRIGKVNSSDAAAVCLLQICWEISQRRSDIIVGETVLPQNLQLQIDPKKPESLAFNKYEEGS